MHMVRNFLQRCLRDYVSVAKRALIKLTKKMKKKNNNFDKTSLEKYFGHYF